MSPLVFEALLFLKTNQRFWDDADVLEAIREACSDRIEERLNEEQQLVELDEDTEDDDSE